MTLSKDALMGASDLVEDEVPLPALGGSVTVRSLPAAYSNDAQSDATEVVTVRGEQTVRVNVSKLEALQVLHCLVNPKLDTLEEALALEKRLGQSWRLIVKRIDELSGVNKEEIEKANRLFQSGGPGKESGQAASNGTAAGSDGPDIPVRISTGAPDAGGGAG